MSTTPIRFIDKNFQSQHSGKCDLLIQCSRKRFSYAVIDQGQDQLKVLFDAEINGFEEISEIFKKEVLLSSYYHKIKIAAETLSFTFVPSEIFSETGLIDYAPFVQAESVADLTISDMRLAQAKNISVFDAELKSLLKEKFGNYKLLGSANSLIEAALRTHASANKPFLLINFNTQTFETVLLQENKLQFYNIFEINAAEDFNYFLLLIIQQTGLNPLESELVISGNISTSDEYYNRLQKYFAKIRFANSGLLINPSDILGQIESHRYFSLIGLNLCE